MTNSTSESNNQKKGKPMLAYHNNPDLKEQAVSEVRWHREQDKLVKGVYWENGKGCLIGCRYHSSDHRQAEVVDGIPYLVARLADTIFEGLPNEKAMMWPERFFAAPIPGADLSLVFYRFMHWLLTDPGMLVQYADEQGKVAIAGVAALYERYIGGGGVTDAEWNSAARAADAADAARAACAAYAAYAARAAYAAAYAAYAADAAYAAAYERMADKLIELLSEATHG